MNEDGNPTLANLLDRYGHELLRRVRARGRGLLRYETAEDLAQGVRLRVLQAASGFEYQGEDAFVGWLTRLIQAHVADRHDYWVAARRNAGAVVRITQVARRSRITAGVDPAANMTGPMTIAERRDLLDIAAQAVDVLLPRDQQIVGMLREDLSIREMAARLGISYEAAERARLRAIERFRRAYELLARR